MTLIVSMTRPDGIVMASNSYLTNFTRSETGAGEYVEEKIKIITVRKTYEMPGTGCLSFWGTWPRSDWQSFLDEFVEMSVREAAGIEEVALRLKDYLKNEICPNKELGFHLGGFSNDRVRKLYHVFYGRQVDEPGKESDYHLNEEDIGAEKDRYRILYNGEPRVTTSVISFLRRFEYEMGMLVIPTRYSLEKAVRFAVFLIRYTHDQIAQSGGIPTVGGKITVATIHPDNTVERSYYGPQSVASAAG